MSKKFQQDEQYVIEDLETLNLITDPFRLRILEAAARQPTTVKRIAGQLDVSPKKLYYHVNMLEEHGLLVVVDTRLVSGILEKWYQTRARNFTVDKALSMLTCDEANGFESLNQILSGVFESTRAEVEAAIRRGLFEEDDEGKAEGIFHIGRTRLAIPLGEQEAFIERLQAFLEEYRFDEPPAGEGYEFLGGTFVVYSIPRPAGEAESDDPSGEEE